MAPWDTSRLAGAGSADNVVWHKLYAGFHLTMAAHAVSPAFGFVPAAALACTFTPLATMHFIHSFAASSRHWFGVRILSSRQEFKALSVIQAQMGHVSPAMMKTYSHIRRKALDEAAKVLQAPFALKMSAPPAVIGAVSDVTAHVTAQPPSLAVEARDFLM